jgi:hypothetical protein
MTGSIIRRMLLLALMPGLCVSGAAHGAAVRQPPVIIIPPIDAAAGPDATATIASIDPMTVDDDDFERQHDPAVWQGLDVQRIGFREGATGWRLWRIANPAKPDGPLWVIPHDDENATFAAAIDAVRSWGGVVIVVDANARDTGYSARFNYDTSGGRQIDPNRNFREGTPIYTGEVLRDLLSARRLIVALHANAEGADRALRRCPGEVNSGGAGDVSVALCTDRVTPRRSIGRKWPFDDDDTLALIPHLTDAGAPNSGYCNGPLTRADFNLVYESVGYSDGSLSNYAAQHGLDYINFETRDRGNDGAGLAEGRHRLISMVDRMMENCAPIVGVALKPLNALRR